VEKTVVLPAQKACLKDLRLESSTVSQARTGPPYIRNATKTRKPRSIPLLPEVVSALKAHRARQNEERLSLARIWHDQRPIFPDAVGESCSARTSRGGISSRS
jgi:integrase